MEEKKTRVWFKALSKSVAEKTSKNEKEARAYIDAFLECVAEELSLWKTVSFRGFGTFSIKDVVWYETVNAFTQKPLKVEWFKKIFFKSYNNLKKKINN